MRRVYLDHAAATPIDKKVAKKMKEVMSLFANPSSFHMPGKEVRDLIEGSRINVANVINARPDEIIFTSGGTESDNMAILGAARQHQETGKHIITTKVEHQAVMEPAYRLEKKEGFEITYLETDKFGIVSAEEVKKSLRKDTILVSIIFGNNEIGSINPIAEIGKVISAFNKENGTKILFHTDACQAIGSVEIDVEKLHVDLLTLNAAKIYGPKGVGALYVKRGTKLQPLQFGGHQEFGRRPGTENVIGIIGLGEAIKIAEENREDYAKKTAELRDHLIKGLQEIITKTRLNGHPEKRLPNNVNISFMDIEGEALLLYMDSKGIAASTGSACTSASLDPSHVITGLGLPYEVAHGSVRFSLGRETTKKDLDYVIKELPPLVEKLRAISPVKVDPKYYE